MPLNNPKDSQKTTNQLETQEPPEFRSIILSNRGAKEHRGKTPLIK